SVRDWRAVAPLKLSAQLAWNAPTFSLSDGTAELARLEHGGLAAETLRASFAYADDALQVRGAEARAFGGHWSQSGQITLADPIVLDGGLRGAQVDTAQLLAALPALGVSAALPQADGQLAVSFDGHGTVGGTLGGHASVELAGGAVTWDGVHVAAPLQIAADVALDDGTATLTNGQARAVRVSRDGLAAEAIDVQFSYAADALRVAPLRLGALGGTWTYTGTLPVRAGGAWTGTLAATAVRLDQAFAAAAAAAPDRAPPGAPPSGALDVRATLSSGPRDSVRGNVSLRLASPALQWEDVRIAAPASVAAGVQIERGQLTLSRGRLDAAGASLAGNAADTLSAQFSGNADRLQLAGLTARAFGGVWQASGTVTPAASPPFNGTISGTGVRLEPLLIAAGQGDGDAPSSPTGVADLRLTLAPAAGGAIGGNATVQLHSGAFLLGDLVVDAPARFASDFRVRDGDLALHGATASAGRAMFGGLGGTQATGQFAYGKERLTFTALHFTAGGGAWSHTGTYSFAGAHAFSGHLTIRDADPRSILLLLSANEPSTIDLDHLDADIDFRGRIVDDWSDTLDASGDLMVRGGTMRSSAVLRALWEAMFGPSRSMDKLGSPNRVDSAGGTFTLESGVVHTQDLALHSADYIATAAGTFALAGPIDLAARFTLTAEGMQKMIAFGSIALPTSSLPPLPPIPAKITGTLDDPIVRPNVAAVPAATLRWFVDAVLHAPRGILSAVVNRGGEAWGATKRLFGYGQPAAPAP
ncbi:MAG: AsmA-like C-terminal region-containing protein, partial [Candidatus Binatia bacterium]